LIFYHVSPKPWLGLKDSQTNVSIYFLSLF
jgi:hypothetical protein